MRYIAVALQVKYSPVSCHFPSAQVFLSQTEISVALPGELVLKSLSPNFIPQN